MVRTIPEKESLTVEFKSDLQRLRDAELVQTAVCLANSDGGEIYFHRNSVTNGGFDKLAIGDEVRFVAQHSESAEGPQASTVVPPGKPHLPPTESGRA